MPARMLAISAALIFIAAAPPTAFAARKNLSGDTGGIKGKTAVPRASQKPKMTIKVRPEYTRSK
jgi:hypothetical protein